MRASKVLIATTFVAACGGGQRSSQSLPASPSLPAGTQLVVFSAETQAPVPGARVIIGGRETLSAANGVATLGFDIPLPWGVPLDVVADGFLDRHTHIREGELRVALWPKVSPTGLHEAFTKQLVYTSTVDNVTVVGMRRPAPEIREVPVTPTSELLSIPQFAAHWVDVLNRVTSATGINHRLEPAGVSVPLGVSVRLEQQPGDETTCATAQAFVRTNGDGAGAIVLCYRYYHPNGTDFATAASRFPTTLLHELGHTFGLLHYSGGEGHGIMSVLLLPSGAVSPPGRGVDFSARERLAMRLMLQRARDNAWPDTGPGIGALIRQDDAIIVD